MKETFDSGPGIGRGAAVVIVLHTPREKCWGVLDELNQAGVFLRGLDLNAFDDWVSALVHNEPFIGFGDLFFRCGAWNASRRMRQRPEYPRFASKSRNERVSPFKSFCGQTTDKLNDFATARRREGCRGAQTDLTLLEIFLLQA